jgi:hypothetical protein
MNYKITTHNNVCVVAISGNISREDRDSLVKCIEEIKDQDFNSAMIFFKNVEAIEVAVFRELTMLQHEIRQKKDRLHLVGLKNTLKIALGEKGVIRGNEVIQDIEGLDKKLIA